MKKRVKVNSEGRVIIPADIRKTLGIKDNDEIEIELVGTEIKLNTLEIKCHLCHNTEALNHIDAIVICDDCLAKLKPLLNPTED